MIRATTPTQQFFIHTNDVKELLITYKQNDIVLQKRLEDVVLDKGIASFVLSQDEANLFDKGLVKVDVRLLTEGNVAFASQTFTTSVRDVLDAQILGDGTKPETNPCACVFDCHFDGCDCFDAQYEEIIKGDKGDDGIGIESVVMNADYTLTIKLTDGTSYTTTSIRGADGKDGYTPIKGKDYFDGKDGKDGLNGKDGVGIASTRLNADYTLTITLTNGQSYTTSSIRGERGEKGEKGADGRTPIKGVDYFTPTEITQIENETEQKVADSIIDDLSTQTNKVWSASKVAQSISDIEMAKSPNVTVIGQPTYTNGQFSGFNANNYLQFPFMVDFKGLPFVIDLETTTGSEVNNQHNILDSAFGLAFAVRNSRFVIAISTNGTSWNIGEGIGSHVIQPNTTYRVRMAWDLSNFVLSYSVDGGTTYITDIVKPLTVQPFPKQMLIGITSDKSTFYNGIINLNYSKLTIGGIVVWTGMDASGIDTRADVSLSNIDELGKQTIRDLAPKVRINGVETSDNNLPYARYNVMGLVKPSSVGFNTANDILSLNNPTNANINSRQSNMAVTCNTLPYAVKSAMSSTTDPSWTEEEKANARERIGLGSYELIANVTTTEEGAISVTDLSLSKIACIVEFPSQLIAGSQNYYVIRVNNSAGGNRQVGAKTITSTGRSFSFKAELVDGFFSGSSTDLATTTSSNVALYSTPIGFVSGGLSKTLSISGFSIVNVIFPIGTNIKVYGVRA